jgi:Transposase DDE domain group 1
MASSHTLDQLDTCFDDTHAVANAGLLLAATLAERLGIEQTADALIDLGERPGAHRPGRKLLTLVHTMIAGGDCIDDADVLRCGATSRVLGHRVMAPSTLGTFLRAFTFGHVRQLDRLTEQVLARAWTAGAGPGDGPMTMDLDSTVCEVHGHAKQGAAYGYTHALGYMPDPVMGGELDSIPGLPNGGVWLRSRSLIASTVMWRNRVPAGISMRLATSAAWWPTSWALSSRPVCRSPVRRRCSWWAPG